MTRQPIEVEARGCFALPCLVMVGMFAALCFVVLVGAVFGVLGIARDAIARYVGG